MPTVPIQPPTDRMIVTTYYVDGRRLECTKVIRSKYARTAAMRAFDNMSMNFYEAGVCVVHDEEYGQDHAIFKRHIDGRVEVAYMRDQTDPRFTNSGSFRMKQPLQFVLKKSKTAEARKNRAPRKSPAKKTAKKRN